MFHYENRHIKITNPIVRKSKSLQWVLIMMHTTLLNPNHPNQCFTASPVRAHERQIRAPKEGILGVLRRGSYLEHVTVCPYNEYIRGTNPVMRHVMPLTCTLKRICADQYTPKHARSPLFCNFKSPAPKLTISGVSDLPGLPELTRASAGTAQAISRSAEASHPTWADTILKPIAVRENGCICGGARAQRSTAMGCARRVLHCCVQPMPELADFLVCEAALHRGILRQPSGRS